jgi:hypothetical protein
MVGDDAPMATWHEIEDDAPDLAKLARSRIEQHTVALLATVRKDGSPRISGIETTFGDGELWLGMMPDSLKAKDLLRDPRFALHGATIDKDVTEPDVKLAGVAVEVEGPAKEKFAEQAPPGPFHLFKLDIRELSSLRPVVDHLELQIWREGRGVEVVEVR